MHSDQLYIVFTRAKKWGDSKLKCLKAIVTNLLRREEMVGLAMSYAHGV